MNKLQKYLLIVFALLAFGQTAWAQEITWTEVGTKEALNSAIADGAHIRLTADITLSEYLKIGQNAAQTVTIDLNSHTMSRILSAVNSNGHVIEVFSNGTLTLQGGTLTGGWANNGGGICNYGTLTLENITIDNCKAVDGGGIKSNTGAYLYIYGGSISNCRSDAGGGAVVNYGTASISDCTLSDNIATTRGGAIWSNNTLTVSGCTFDNNEALAVGGNAQNEGDGGAIHVNGGTTTMTNVTLTSNLSKDAGAIYVASGATLNLGGTSTISGNTSSAHGGGGIVNQGTTNLSGNISITGNTCATDGSGIWSNGTLSMKGNVQIKNNTNDDVFLKSGKVIAIEDALTGGAESIGICIETPGVFTSGYQSHNTVTNPFFPSGTINPIFIVGGEAKMYYGYYECSWDSENKRLVHTVKAVPDDVTVYNVCSTMFASGGGLSDSRWFIADGTGSTANGITCGSGDRHLILCDDAQITINEGLFVNAGTTLHIYCQSYGDRMGKLISTGDDQQPGIGPKHNGSYAGVIDIHGGDLKATGGEYAAGIGGCEDRSSGNITIWDGKIEATGGTDAAGIGGGEGGSGTGTYFYGGNISARGGTNAAGIGGGESNNGGGDSGRIVIYGGEISAIGGGELDPTYSTHGAGIGNGDGGTQVGPIIIHGGKVTAWGGDSSAAIGGSKNSSWGTIEIHGGEVTAWAGQNGAGIGGGLQDDTDNGHTGNILVEGGVVMAYARHRRDVGFPGRATNGAGIGGGLRGDGGSVTINGGLVIASSENGAAIGGGCQGNGGTITINDGEIMAVSLQGGAGIGGGQLGEHDDYGAGGGNITINGGEIVAVGGGEKLTFMTNPYDAYSIFMQTLSGGIVSAEGQAYTMIISALVQVTNYLLVLYGDDPYGGAGIGGGWKGEGGNITIAGGTVAAFSGHAMDEDNRCAEAIGHGYLNSDSGTLSIYPLAMVTAGNNESNASLKLKNERIGACRERYAKVEPCGHKDATNYTDNGDGTYTASGCSHCLLEGAHTLSHIFAEEGDWNIGSHWKSSHVPVAGNDVIIKAPCEIPSGYTAEADTIHYVTGDTLIIHEGGQLYHSNAGVMAMVEKSIAPYSDNGGYYLIANPTLVEQNPDTLGMTTNNYDLYYFDQSQELEWRNYKQVPFNLTNGTGYLYANSAEKSLAFCGTLNRANADVSVPLAYDANADLPGFNLIGNPFVCNAYLADSRPFYILNDDGDEVVLSETSSIAPMQGVFVQAAADESTVSFTTTEPVQGKALTMSLTHNQGSRGTSTIDNARIRFEEGQDLEKFQLNPNHSKVYFQQGEKEYAVVNADNTSELPLNFKAAENGTYTLRVRTEGLEMDYLHLIDNMTGNDVDLLQTPSYSFEAKTTDYKSRFKLVFSANDEDGPSKGSDTFAFVSNGNIIVDGEGTLQVIDMTGRIVLSGDAKHCVSTTGMTAGVYVLRLINGDDVKTQKMVIE